MELEMRALDYTKVEEILVDFIKDEFKKAGFTKAVIGMSGGIDSSVSANLAVKALGKENVYGILMPYKKVKGSAVTDIKDAEKICKHLGMPFHVQDITGVVDSMIGVLDSNVSFDGRTNGNDYSYKLRVGNVCARVRMMVLFDFSSANKSLVLGTENLTESASEFRFNKKGENVGYGGFGYFTMFGDSASSIEPIINLYKTEVFEFARHLGLPEFVIKKAPSARLWDGHNDEREMGISYADADEILFYMNEEKWEREHFEKVDFDMAKVDKVIELKNKGAFKSNIPVILRSNKFKDCILYEMI